MKKKLTALALGITLALSLTACASASIREHTDPPEPTPTPDPRYTDAYAKHAPDDVVMTVNGYDVTWEEYFYLIYANLSQMEAYGVIDDFDAVSPDGISSYDQYFLDAVNEYEKRINAGRKAAADQGVSISDADKAEIAATWRDQILAYGQQRADLDVSGLSEEETYAVYEKAAYEFLGERFLTKAVIDTLDQSSFLISKLFTKMFGEEGADLPAADVISYAAEKDWLCAKHILFFTQNSDGAEKTDDEKEQVRVKAQETLDELLQLQAAGDRENLLVRFDELMNSLSEDTGLAGFPDGYTFQPATMMPEFTASVQASKEYEVAPTLVQTTYGYHITLRLPLTADGLALTSDNQSVPLRSLVAEAQFNALLDDWIGRAEIKYTPAFEGFTLKSIF